MPKPLLHALIWSHEQKHYKLYSHGQPEQCFPPGDEPAFSRWLDGHTAFAFEGQAGRISVLKEARRGGTGYWYAYRTQNRHTRKRYLGRTAKVTFARLEQEARVLDSSPSPASLAKAKASPLSEQKGMLLSTKLSPPRLPISLVERSRLLRELDAVRSHRLTLVSASAGSGKTTLLSAWMAASSKPQASGSRAGGLEHDVAWLSLDELDNDPIRFWTSVIAALRTCLPRVGKMALAMLHSQEAPPLSTILTALLNELVQGSREIILILDDYHVISDQTIHDGLLFLLDHLPPNLCLVLATRADPELPLSRFRVRGQMVEIRSSDLRFTQEETTSFLLQSMGLPLSEEDVATLQHRTEGWIAGLQLAALSLRKRQDLSGWVSDFAGSYRYLLDYVQQDILARLPVPLQHFLLQTSILTRMNAALCQAVTAASGEPASQEMLEAMERAAPHFWLSGEARTVHIWVLALPDIVLRAHMRLALDAALRFLNFVHISTATVHASMAAQVERTITRMEEILRRKPPLLLSEAEVALIGRRLRLLRALIEVRAYFTRGDKERLRLLTQEVEALPPDEEVSWKMIPLSFAFWLTLAFQQDSALLVGRLRAAKQWISEAGDHLVTFRVMTWLARAYIEAGQLHLAHQECLSALTLLEQIGGSTPVAGFLLASLFDISYAWNRLEEASDALCRLLRIAQDWPQVELLVIGERAVAQLALARGDLGTAQEALYKAEALDAQEEFANNARWVVETRVQVWLAQGNLAEASTWAAQTTLSPEDWDPLRKWEVLLLVRVSLAQQQYAQAVETLERFREHLDQPADTLNIEKMLEWMALYVVALHHGGKSAQAARVAARLFAMTEPESCIRLYLDAEEPMRQALEALLKVAGKRGSDATQ